MQSAIKALKLLWMQTGGKEAETARLATNDGSAQSASPVSAKDESRVAGSQNGVAVATETTVSITVVGASGDLAKKKIFPALFALYYEGCLPKVRHTVL